MKAGRVDPGLRCGFTLMELLIAMALGLIIMGMTAYAFNNTSRAASRSLSMLDLSTKARSALEMMRQDFNSRQPGTELLVENEPWISFKGTCLIGNTKDTDLYRIRLAVVSQNTDANYDGDNDDANDNAYAFNWVEWGIGTTDDPQIKNTEDRTCFYLYRRTSWIKNTGSPVVANPESLPAAWAGLGVFSDVIKKNVKEVILYDLGKAGTTYPFKVESVRYRDGAELNASSTPAIAFPINGAPINIEYNQDGTGAFETDADLSNHANNYPISITVKLKICSSDGSQKSEIRMELPVSGAIE